MRNAEATFCALSLRVHARVRASHWPYALWRSAQRNYVRWNNKRRSFKRLNAQTMEINWTQCVVRWQRGKGGGGFHHGAARVQLLVPSAVKVKSHYRKSCKSEFVSLKLSVRMLV